MGICLFRPKKESRTLPIPFPHWVARRELPTEILRSLYRCRDLYRLDPADVGRATPERSARGWGRRWDDVYAQLGGSAAALAHGVSGCLAAVTDTDGARTYLTEQRRAHTTRLRELTALKSDPEAPIGDVVTADFAIAHIDADLRWMQTTLDRVAELHQEVHS